MKIYSKVAQFLERGTDNAEVAGEIPALAANFARERHNREVASGHSSLQIALLQTFLTAPIRFFVGYASELETLLPPQSLPCFATV